MAIYPAYPNSEIYILKNIPITNEDKVNFYGKSAEFQAGYFLGAEYKTPINFLRDKEKLDSIDISAMLTYYPNCVYVGLKYSVIKSNYIEIPINIYNLQSGNYLVFRNNIKPYVTSVEPDSDSVDVSHREDIFNDIYRSGETKLPILDWASTDFIYAFITNLEYINANATRVYFAVDKFTTYCRNIQYKECLIEREHDDKNKQFYYDFINEDFQYEIDEKSYLIHNVSNTAGYCLVVCEGDISSKYFPKDTTSVGAANEYSNKVTSSILGINSTYAIYAVNTPEIKRFLTDVASIGNADLIKCIVPLPTDITDYLTFTPSITEVISNNNLSRTFDYNTDDKYFTVRRLVKDGNYYPYKYFTSIVSKAGKEFTKTFTLPTGDKTIQNNKTLSYIKLSILGNESISYKTHWLKGNSITLVEKITQIIPQLTYSLYIKDGDGIDSLSLLTNYTTNIQGAQFQFSYDTYLQNLANETASINYKKEIANTNALVKTMIGITSVTAGLIAIPTAGASLATVAPVIAGSTTIANAIAGAKNDYDRISSTVANTGADNSTTSSSIGWNDKYVLGCLGFYLNISYPNHSYTTMIDDYFSAYGYKTNRIGKPRFITGATGNRKYYNYIKTTNCNYILNRPFEDINEIRQIFNNGVRIWTPYNYTDFAEGRICFGDKVTVNTNNPNA